MFKMRSPAFPPRRASHITRYIFPALLILCLFYYFSNNPADHPGKHLSSTPQHAPSAPIPPNAVDESSLSMHAPPPTSESKSKSEPESSTTKNDHEVEDIGKTKDKQPGSMKDSYLKSTSQSDKGDEKTEKPLISSDRVKSESSESSGKKVGFDSKESSSGQSKSGTSKANDGTTSPTKEKEKPLSQIAKDHPIDHLIKTADKEFKELMTKESTTLSEAAKAYRERRGRHPPPGFNEWYDFAKDNDAVVIEDLFDRIYHDLHPFWGVDPKFIRKEAHDFEMTINIRDGNASAESDWFWTQIWLKLIKTVEHMLPDMDLALNAMDEPRVVVPWEEMEEVVQKADKTRKIVPTKEIISTYDQLPPVGKGVPLAVKQASDRRMHWEDTKPFWLIARRGCAPDSPARRMPALESFDHTPKMTPSMAAPHQYEGYVSNFSLSTEFCHQPDLQGLEGIFINPLTVRSTRVLFPLFGGSKLAVNNEILLPPPMYWNEEDRFTGNGYQGISWEQKIDPLIWRGVATGGRNKADNWKGFQRHRFVAMNNGTQLLLAEEDIEAPINFQLPDPSYNVRASKDKKLGEWVHQWANVGLTEFMCDPDFTPEPEDGACPYVDQHFELIEGVDLVDQFDYKYLPDIDGNSFSGRYLAFLRSTGVPIKSTMWHEWHDSRLVAWKHFVPMDNRFGDYYGIMEYFLGSDKTAPGHDKEAKKIAMDGKEWAGRVLRKEDMQVYVLRLLLEYARVSADERETMGWADDLRSS
ncbi:glycosyltransferase family 90 protein [Xylariaceae sp. FL0255]|nr:glycosyltransferase family 90 protein [Xylariaceae sp. FL0255]